MPDGTGRKVTLQITEKQIRSHLSAEKYFPDGYELGRVFAEGLKCLMTDGHVVRRDAMGTPIKFELELRACFDRDPNRDGRTSGRVSDIADPSE